MLKIKENCKGIMLQHIRSSHGFDWIVLLVFTSCFLVTNFAFSAVYQVGPARSHVNLQSVAHLLDPGDVVEVDGGVTYPGDVRFTRAGSEAEPIIIRGIRQNGERPVISGGINTVHFMTDYPYSGPGGDHYIFEGFEITGGSSRCIFHQADDLTIRDTVVRDCPSHGILGADQGSGSLTLQYVEVYNCGEGTYRHQIYMATDEIHYPGSIFRMEYCYVHDGNGGNNIKSRAERNEIYYNWVEGAYYHELELIGPDGGDGGDHSLAREDSDVVGNVFIKTGSNSDFFVFRVGGDGTGETDGRYRFINNTIIGAGSSVFRLFHGIESIEMHNNVFYRHNDSLDLLNTSSVSWATGSAKISGSNNWVSSGTADIPTEWTNTTTGDDPHFSNFSLNDFRPLSTSPLVDEANMSPEGPPGYPFPSPLWPPEKHPFLHSQLSNLETVESRVNDGMLDIGAYEAPCDITGNCVSAPPVAAFSTSSTRGEVPLTVQFTDISLQQPTSWSWDFGDGVTSSEQSPEHTYLVEGVYTVGLTVSNGEGSDSEVKRNFIRAGTSYSNPVMFLLPVLSDQQ